MFDYLNVYFRKHGFYFVQIYLKELLHNRKVCLINPWWGNKGTRSLFLESYVDGKSYHIEISKYLIVLCLSNRFLIA